MICKNCDRETGASSACPYCGYDPAIDENEYVQSGNIMTPNKNPTPLQITLLKSPNGMAIASLILAFFGLIPLFIGVPFWLLSFIFSLVGIAKSRIKRSGKGAAIAALIIDILVVVAWVVIFIVAVALGASPDFWRSLD